MVIRSFATVIYMYLWALRGGWSPQAPLHPPLARALFFQQRHTCPQLFCSNLKKQQAKARHGDMHAEPGGPNCQFVRCAMARQRHAARKSQVY